MTDSTCFRTEIHTAWTEVGWVVLCFLQQYYQFDFLGVYMVQIKAHVHLSEDKLVSQYPPNNPFSLIRTCVLCKVIQYLSS